MASATSHPEIVTCTDNVIKPNTDDRKYRALELKNGLKILVISDPDADKAAASLNVHIGNMSDPDELPGLAHFCEHMLFLGTKKYPGENTYTDFVTTHGGHANASTSTNNTKYYFEVAPEKFKEALDIFAQFFIDPLFTESATERELNAVDSENQKNVQNDGRRRMQLERALSKPDHDYGKFGTGNKMTLETMPKESGINTREELLKFHDMYYSANLMGLCILSKESLDDMTVFICDLFSQIVNKDVKSKSWSDHPFGKEQLGKRVTAVPVKDIRELYLIWPFPDVRQYWETVPDRYINHLIGHKGSGSLLSAMKAKGWVTRLHTWAMQNTTGFSSFKLYAVLTEEGMEHVDEIITMIYQYLNMLKREGPQESIFEEGKNLNEMNFKFKDKEQPLSVVYAMSRAILLYPLEECASGDFLWKKYEPEILREFTDLLTPENMIVTVVGKKFEGKTDLKEKWYGTNYKIEDLAASLLDKWRQPDVHEDIHLPQKNEFIPHNFDLCQRDPENSDYPRIIKDTDLSRVWFKQDNEYKLPKLCMSIAIRSPVVNSSPLNANLVWLYLRLFNDAFTEYSYDAELTKLKYNLTVSHYGLLLGISGYSDKLHVLLKTVMNTLVTFQADPNRVAIFREEYERNLRNFAMSQPTHQVAYYINLLIKEGDWTIEELLDSVDDMNIEALNKFVAELFSRIFLESLIFGNGTVMDALNMIGIVEESLMTAYNSKVVPQSQQTRLKRNIQLPNNCSFLFNGYNDIQPNSCVYSYYQVGMEDTHTGMLLELLLQIIKDPIFNTLRTQEQLGYIVGAYKHKSSGVHGMRVLVQSGKHPTLVDSRIEAFLNTVVDLLEKITEEEFQSHISGLVTARLCKPKNMKARHSKYWNEISTEKYMFNRDQIETEYVKTLTKQQLIDFYKDRLAESSELRHKLCVYVVAKEHRQASGDNIDGKISTGAKEASIIENHTSFKRSMQLFPLPQPAIDLPKRSTVAKSKL